MRSLTSSRVERFETLVIGGGQAGLAAGKALADRNIEFVILDAGARVGDVWRERWDSLRLFTPARFSALPGMVFPAPPDHFPDKDEVADYLERYAERFELPIRLGTRVASLTRRGDHFVADCGGVRYEAEQVVVATGPFQRPFRPALAANLTSEIHQLHSSEYRTPFDLPEGSVLVVGAGNSGAQIALELSRFRKVWLAGRSPGHLPRRWLGRDVFSWLWPVMARADDSTLLGRRLRTRLLQKSDALIGMTEHDLAQFGLTRVARVDDVRGGLPTCAGEVIHPRVVIWCTGYTQDYGWIDLPLPRTGGAVRHVRGVVAELPGLFFVGQRFQRRLSSSLLGGVGVDAEEIATLVAQRAALIVA